MKWTPVIKWQIRNFANVLKKSLFASMHNLTVLITLVCERFIFSNQLLEFINLY